MLTDAFSTGELRSGWGEDLEAQRGSVEKGQGVFRSSAYL
jgi:hypothetical protein